MSHKPKVYLDTSAISCLNQQDNPEKMQETNEAWKFIEAGKYDVYISDIVADELEGCEENKRNYLFEQLARIPWHFVHTTDEVIQLAEKFVDSGIMKRKNIADCLHIAAAIVSGCDIIVSWNFKHIVNYKTIRGIRAISILDGYKELLIYPPPALLEEEDL